MKSLRTDDIVGARPKVRHAPRALVREQLPYQRSYIMEPQYINSVNLSQSFNQKSPVQYQKYESGHLMNDEVEKPITHEKPYILPKQMPKISYELPNKQSYYPEEKVSREIPKKEQDERIYSRRNSKSQNAIQPIQEKKEKANIFRGLGYNIITNHKYSIDMVNKYKNSTSPWLNRP